MLNSRFFNIISYTIAIVIYIVSCNYTLLQTCIIRRVGVRTGGSLRPKVL